MADALQSVLAQAGLALAPLRADQDTDQAQAFFKKLGYDVPITAFGGALATVSARAGDLTDAIRMLVEATGEGGIAAAAANLFARLIAVIEAIAQLHGQIKAGGGGGLPEHR